MKDHTESESHPQHQGSATDIIGLIKGLQQQLSYLERKIDTLIERSQQKPPFRDKPYSTYPKPSRGYERPAGQERYREHREHGKGSYDSRHSGPKPKYSSKKKVFYHQRKERH